MNKKKQFAALLILPFALTFLSGCNEPTQKEIDMSIEKVQYYMASTLIPPDEVSLGFPNGNKDIAYFEAETVVPYMINFTQVEFEGVADTKKQTYTISRKDNGSCVTFDFKNDKIIYSSLDTFFIFLNKLSGIDVISNAYNEPTKGHNMLRIVDTALPYLSKKETVYDCKKYGIDLIWSKGKGYIPVPTFSDLVLGKMNVGYIWNGINTLACLPGGVIEPSILAVIFNGEKRTRTPNLIDFNYRELCMNLDYNFGLNKKQSVNDFDRIFKELGYETKLKDPDPLAYSEAFAEFINLYIDDLHSSVHYVSCYNDIFYTPTAKHGISYTKLFNTKDSLTAQFKEAFGEDHDPSLPWYQESGDTAFVSFGNFTNSSTVDYYDEQYAPKEGNTQWFIDKKDTIGLIEYAHKMITRDGSPIKKMVLDLSINTGGSLDVASGVNSWMVGHTSIDSEGNEKIIPAMMHSKNPMTGSTFSCGYQLDVNLDGKFDKYDFLSTYGIERYCLISNVSFSCGNYVPSILKNSGQVTLIGQRSGGGTNAVANAVTADGIVFRISGLYQLCTYHNGQYINVENGADPDYFIGNTSTFYDSTSEDNKEVFRGKLINFINNLYC